MKALCPILLALAAFVPCVHAQTDTAQDRTEWWKSFGDPVLDQVVQEVFASNFDLEAAVARVEQARMKARLARASRLPLVQPSVGGSDSSTPTNAGIGAQLDELGLGNSLEQLVGVALPDRLGLTTYNASLEFAYEVDFWGRNRNYSRAAGASQLASESDFTSARIGIVAASVGTYLEVLNIRTQHTLSMKKAEIARELDALANSRYERGLIDIQAVYAARRSRRLAEAEVPRIEALQVEAEGRLWVLMGGFNDELAVALPDSMVTSESFPAVPESVGANLLLQRPDVSAARLRVESARFSVGARRAELWPRLSLQGFIGLQGTDIDEWFDVDQWFRNLSVNLVGPLIQGSRRRSQLALARAQLDEATAAYGRSVVTAVSEVEAALAGLQSSRKRYELLSDMAQDSDAERALMEYRYSAGIISYEQYLLAKSAHLDARSMLSSAQHALGSARLALHRALGGTWTADVAGPSP